jgi:uncharacterized protein
VNPLDVVGVRVEMPANQPIVLLREVSGERYHDLFRDVLAALGQELQQVRITGLRDGVFYAELIFGGGVEVSARPSDAIALALRTGTPIFGSEEVLDEAGIAIPDEQEDEVEKFREFLDTITPEDFGTTG